MEISEYKNIFENETTHFLYTSRHNLVLTLARRHLPKHTKNTCEILDAGCGTGLLAKKLSKFGHVRGVDIHPEALRFSKIRGVFVKKASVTKLPFKKNTFDLVTSIDVIYHESVQSDQKALKEFYRVLKPSGIAIIRVAANKWLQLSHDKHVHTRQRYSYSEFKHKLTQSGFVIKKLSFVHALLLPPTILQQLKEYIIPPKHTASGITSLPPLFNNILSSIFSIETKIIPYMSIPFGIGLIAVCQKPHAASHDTK